MFQELTEWLWTPLEENCPVAELAHQTVQRKQYFVNELYSSNNLVCFLFTEDLNNLLLETGAVQIASPM